MTGIGDSTGVQYASGGDFYDHILNDMFLPAVADTVINPNQLVKELPRDKTRVQGKLVKYPIHTGRNLGGNAVGAGGNLPDPQAQGYDGYSFPIRHVYQRILFDGISMDASKSDVASWLRVVDSEVKGATMDMTRRRNRIFNGDGSGRLCMLAAAVTADTTIEVDHLDGAYEGNGTISEALFAPTKFIKAGMNIGFVTSGAAVDGVSTVASVTDGDTFETGGAVTLTDASYVTEVSRSDSTALADFAFRNEPMGIAGIFSDGDIPDGNAITGFQGISSTAGDNFNQATVLDNGAVARDLTEALLQKAYSDTIEIGEGSVDFMFSSFGMVNTYIDLLIGDKRYPNTTTLSGGATMITFNGVPWIADRDCRSNGIYLIDRGNIRVYVMSDPTWMNYDGSSYHRLENKDAYQATLYCRETIGVDVRDKCTLIVDLNQIAA